MIVCPTKKDYTIRLLKKDEKEEVYQCMCKLIPTVDPNKVKVY
jgi:hypothetical protein